jgi:hypothetical protein
MKLVLTVAALAFPLTGCAARPLGSHGADYVPSFAILSLPISRLRILKPLP